MKRHIKDSHGFTLVEVSVVLGIVLILGAVAFPQWSSYQDTRYTRIAQDDLRNVAIAESLYFAKNGTYVDLQGCTNQPSDATCPVDTLPGLTNLSKGVSVQIVAKADGFEGTAKHARSKRTCTWDSTKGGLLGCY